ncbi:MAG: hypothetical protein K9N34_02360 [Candidatus Marinimicrobia bacterium]|nr:hypothetical protein [Candidatus Neomarinimicrobiota bacterium]
MKTPRVTRKIPAKVTGKFLVSLTVLLLSISPLSAFQDTLQITTDLPCQACHIDSQWDIIRPSSFDHSQTLFPLEGQHRNADCIQCHTGTSLETIHQFDRARTECASCHNDPHQGQLGDNCQRCHTDRTWQPRTETFDHNTTRFLLLGAHASVACDACHSSAGRNEYQGLPLDCAGCHLDTYQQTVDPDHAASGLSTDCLECHRISAPFWETSTFEHTLERTGFELTGAHSATDCSSCHTGQTTGTPQDCWACHQTEYETTTDPPHAVDAYPQDCALCHDTQDWATATFDHNRLGFALVGGHAQLTCDNCHADQNFQIQSGQCVSCHATDVTEIPDFSHESADFGPTCDQCHTVFNWANTNYDHNIQTDYPLTGAHVSASCGDCHGDGVFQELAGDCYACHQADYETAENPEHLNAGFPTNCTECHSTSGWATLTIDHDLTAFPLVGRHRTADCMACHDDGYDLPLNCEGCHDSADATEWDHEIRDYPANCDQCHSEFGWTPISFNHSGISSGCNDCHAYDYTQTAASTTAPDHVASGFSSECQVCHSTQVWAPAFFDHSEANTGFPLVGAHSALVPDNCTSCHINNQWAGTPHDCFSAQCHAQDYNNTTDPNHAERGYPMEDCTICHDESGFEPSIFQHNNTASACVTCHQYDYNNTNDPNHTANEFSTQCQVCHTTNAWSPDILNHDETGFPLIGEHQNTDCNACHVNDVYAGTPMNCWDAQCHLTDFNETDDPDHQAEGFRLEDCALCHTPVDWEPSIFTHENLTESCDACHSNDIPATPDHTGFPATCDVCHNTVQWSPSHFNHSEELTGFHLLGQHYDNSFTNCNLCHIDNQWSGISTDCFGANCHASTYGETSQPVHSDQVWNAEDCEICHTPIAWTPSVWSHANVTTCMPCHTADKAAAQDPPHADFPDDCAQCHATNAWSPAEFDHSETQTGFALTGAHQNTDCTVCHADGYDPPPTPRSCADADCHLADYNATTNPNHASSDFPMDCESCHTTTQWEGADFDHDGMYFPIYSGEHRNEWDACSDCHTNTSNYADFTCFGGGCHNVAEENAEHCEDGCESCNGFTYPATGVTAADCLFCHPNGDEDDCEGDDDDLRRPPNFQTPLDLDWRNVD